MQFINFLKQATAIRYTLALLSIISLLLSSFTLAVSTVYATDGGGYYGDYRTIHTDSVGYECDENEWHFLINQLDADYIAPDYVSVVWDNGNTEDVSLEEITGGSTAHYRTSNNLDATLVGVSAQIAATWSGQFNVSHGPDLCDTPQEPPETFGSIEVCKVIVDRELDVLDGSENPGTFSVEGVAISTHPTVPDAAGLIPTTQFSTPLSLNTDLFGGDQVNDAECVLYDELTLGSYYYAEEGIDGGNWRTPLYNDGNNTPANTIENFFEYSGEIFTDDGGIDDASRNTNADGHITLTEERPDRTLVVLNTYALPEPRGCVLELTKTDSPDPVLPGGYVAYHLTLENVGDQNCSEEGARVHDQWDILTSLEDYSHDGQSASEKTDSIEFNFGPMEPGDTGHAELRMNVSVEAVPGEYLTNTAYYWSKEIDENNKVIANTLIGEPTNPDTFTIVADKVVCTDEAELPNWGDGLADGVASNDIPAEPIGSTTAATWVSEHDTCTLEQWEFQWAPSDTANPGDNTGVAAEPWSTFTESEEIEVSENMTRVWIREVWNDAYIPFTGGNQSQDESAELYCASDVLNYDNYDYITIDDQSPGEIYYCVGFNSPEPEPVYQCSDGIDNDGDNTIDWNGTVIGDIAFPPDPGCDGPEDNDESDDPNLPPVAQITAPTSIILGDSVTVDGSGSTDGDGTIVEYAWDFGDGSDATSSTDSMLHTYTSIGTYIITLVVTDNDDAASGPATTSVEVIPAPVYQCSDGLDNDDDGLIDYPNDPGCDNPEDDNEWNAPTCNVEGYKYNARTDAPIKDWTIGLAVIGECVDGDEWADTVVDYNPEGDISAERTNAENALGEAQQTNAINFVSLGYGGSLTLAFDNVIINGAGDDIEVFETTYNDTTCESYPETIEVYASESGADGSWHMLGTGCKGSTYDLGSLDQAQYIKLVDISDADDAAFSGSGDGFDVDGVRALNCGVFDIVATTTTNTNGHYCFSEIDEGEYSVFEALEDGWSPADVQVDSASVDWQTGVLDVYTDITVIEFQNRVVDFYNSFTVPYAPYCGDGLKNQEWEECDAGHLIDSYDSLNPPVGCSQQCQYVSAPVCTDLTLAQVTVDEFETYNDGDFVDDIYLGATDNRIPAGAWFATYWTGWNDPLLTYVNDLDIEGYDDVPGFAVQRDTGDVRVVLHGSQGSSDKESARGSVNFWNVDITNTIEDSVNPLEGDITTLTYSMPGNDYLMWIDENRVDYALSVNAHDDGFWAHAGEAPMCTEPENKLPVAAVTATSPVIVGNSSTVDGSSSLDPDGVIIEYAWDFGDGNEATTTASTTNYIYTGGGIYEVYLVVTDDDGATSSPATTTVLVQSSGGPSNDAPHADIVAPSSIVLGNEVTLDGSGSSDSDGTIVLYTWDYGNGVNATSTASTTDYMYAATGTYAVSLMVTDDDGAMSPLATTSLEVTATTSVYECSDQKDNDEDGLVDAEDPTCHSDGDPENPDSYTPEKDTELNTKPVITVEGSNPVTITKGSAYTDAGATADDVEDGDITSDIVEGGDTVQTNTVGSYTITYNVTDSEGLAADEATRTVKVIEPPCVGCGGGGTPTGGGGGGPIATPIVIYDEEIEDLGDGAAIITWKTNVPATSQVVYGDDSIGLPTLGETDNYGYDTATTEALNLITEHSLIVTGLMERDTYFFRPVSDNSNAAEVYGIELSVESDKTIVVSQCNYLLEYIQLGADNNPVEVRKLETFLNEFEGEDLIVNGVYEQVDFDAVEAFQEKYFADILGPWGHDAATGYVYITTKKKINEVYCEREFPLTDGQENEIEGFRNVITGIAEAAESGGIGGSLENLDIDNVVGVADDEAEGNGVDSGGFFAGLFGGDNNEEQSAETEAVEPIDLNDDGVIDDAEIAAAEETAGESQGERNIAAAIFGGLTDFSTSWTGVLILALLAVAIVALILRNKRANK